MLKILNQVNNVSTFVLQFLIWWEFQQLMAPSKYFFNICNNKIRPFSRKGWIDSIPMFQQMLVIFNILKLVRSAWILECIFLFT